MPMAHTPVVWNIDRPVSLPVTGLPKPLPEMTLPAPASVPPTSVPLADVPICTPMPVFEIAASPLAFRPMKLP